MLNNSYLLDVLNYRMIKVWKNRLFLEFYVSTKKIMKKMGSFRNLWKAV